MHCKCCTYGTYMYCFAVHRDAQLVDLFPRDAHPDCKRFLCLPVLYAEPTQPSARWWKIPGRLFTKQDSDTPSSSQTLPSAAHNTCPKLPLVLQEWPLLPSYPLQAENMMEKLQPQEHLFHFFPNTENTYHRLRALLKAGKNTCIIFSCT